MDNNVPTVITSGVKGLLVFTKRSMCPKNVVGQPSLTGLSGPSFLYEYKNIHAAYDKLYANDSPYWNAQTATSFKFSCWNNSARPTTEPRAGKMTAADAEAPINPVIVENNNTHVRNDLR